MGLFVARFLRIAPSKRWVNWALAGLFVVLAGVVSYSAVKADTFNSDGIGLFVLLFDGWDIPGNFHYLPAHTNALKIPLFWLGLTLFGWSERTISFIDLINLLGLYLLLYATLAKVFFRQAARIFIFLGCAYLALSSVQWYSYITLPSIRNVELGLGFVWLALLIGPLWRQCWLQWLLNIGLGLLLLVNDPWMLSAYFVPAIFAVAIETINRANHVKPLRLNAFAPLLRSVALVFITVTLYYLLRMLANMTDVLRIINTESDFKIVTVDSFWRNMAITAESLANYFNLWIPGNKVVSLPTLQAAANGCVLVLGIVGWRIGISQRWPIVRTLAWFLLSACLLSVVLFAFSNFVKNTSSGRYLILLPVSVAFGIVLLLAYLDERGSLWRFVVAGLVCGAMILNIPAIKSWEQSVHNPARYDGHYATLSAVRQLQSEGITRGYADYWSSVNYSYYLSRQVTIGPVLCPNRRLLEFHYLTQQVWFNPQLHPNAKPAQKTFVLIDYPGLVTFVTCTRADVIAQFGTPAETRTVTLPAGRKVAEILIWNKDIAGELDDEK